MSRNARHILWSLHVSESETYTHFVVIATPPPRHPQFLCFCDPGGDVNFPSSFIYHHSCLLILRQFVKDYIFKSLKLFDGGEKKQINCFATDFRSSIPKPVMWSPLNPVWRTQGGKRQGTQFFLHAIMHSLHIKVCCVFVKWNNRYFLLVQ